MLIMVMVPLAEIGTKEGVFLNTLDFVLTGEDFGFRKIEEAPPLARFQRVLLQEARRILGIRKYSIRLEACTRRGNKDLKLGLKWLQLQYPKLDSGNQAKICTQGLVHKPKICTQIHHDSWWLILEVMGISFPVLCQPEKDITNSQAISGQVTALFWLNEQLDTQACIWFPNYWELSISPCPVKLSAGQDQ
ncbi:hypothetical protein VNO77_42637 [Canavalia gladiata]|uniref:Uncharacterized protein n=1 Tax=Canavalia gladiata TaxID=3824 RepID=A0AAN9JSP2_CANGL